MNILRVEYWKPEEAYKDFSNISRKRVLDAAYVIKDEVVRRLRSQIGRGKTTGINRPVYLTGDYPGEPWTAREAGQMLKSVRVVEREEKEGVEIWHKQNVRVYVGHYLAFYANIFEFYRPFMRPAIAATLPKVKDILGTK